ncbi:MAG: CPBP family intramembrane glutamic endopeptidase [Candidatus Zixiibacteriota bacterium]
MERKISPWLAFVIGGVIFLIARQAILIPELIAGDTIQETYPWLKQVSLKTALLLISFIGTLIVTRGSISRHGYCRPKNMNWWGSIWPGLLMGSLSTIIIVVTPAKGMGAMMSNSGSPGVVMLLLLYSSISEEIHARGFIQSIISHLSHKKVNLLLVKVSVPVFTSALFFGCMHLSIFFAGSDILTTIIVMLNTFALGLMAGYLFEKHESIIPAIIVHIAGNAGGVLTGIIANILSFIITGEFIMKP